MSVLTVWNAQHAMVFKRSKPSFAPAWFPRRGTQTVLAVACGPSEGFSIRSKSADANAVSNMANTSSNCVANQSQSQMRYIFEAIGTAPFGFCLVDGLGCRDDRGGLCDDANERRNSGAWSALCGHTALNAAIVSDVRILGRIHRRDRDHAPAGLRVWSHAWMCSATSIHPGSSMTSWPILGKICASVRYARAVVRTSRVVKQASD